MNQNNGCGTVVVVVGVLTALSMMINSCNNNGYTPTTTPSSNNSFEHRYVKERVKLEGYSDKEAQQAADAIIKFHNAQKNRK